METTICPWCQTEIVWDEELGPEEECPYCHNELNGYRTLTFGIDSAEDMEEGAEQYEEDEHDDHAGHTHLHHTGGSAAHLFHAAGHDPLVYESAIEKLLDSQDEVPECPHCREYMIFSGHHASSPSQFKPVVLPGHDKPLLSPQLNFNVFICPACFHVSQFLVEEDRLSFMKAVSKED